MAGRKRKPKTEEEFLADLENKMTAGLGEQTYLAVMGGDALTFDKLDDWHRKNGTPFVKVDSTALERAARYREVVLAALDTMAPYLPLVGATLVQKALEGDVTAAKLIMRYFITEVPQQTDVNVNQQTLNVTVVEDRRREAIAKLEALMANNVVSDPAVDAVYVESPAE